MNRDNRSNSLPKLILNSNITTNTNTDAGEIDVADYDGGVKFNVFASAYTDGDYAVQIHASDTSGFTPSSATLLSGDELIPSSAAITISAVSTPVADLESVGALTAQRYVVVRIVSTSVTTGANIVVTAELSPEIKPIS